MNKQVECAQLCGNAHAAMSGGFILVQTQQEFDDWIKSKSAAGAPPSFE
jgi:heme/copper-type cytochrome/quinol oxidase subunit 2